MWMVFINALALVCEAYWTYLVVCKLAFLGAYGFGDVWLSPMEIFRINGFTLIFVVTGAVHLRRAHLKEPFQGWITLAGFIIALLFILCTFI